MFINIKSDRMVRNQIRNQFWNSNNIKIIDLNQKLNRMFRIQIGNQCPKSD